jgi:hypothetical protein
VKKGDILLTHRKLGFGQGKRDRYLVLQDTQVEDTVVVAIIDASPIPHPLTIPTTGGGIVLGALGFLFGL